jgi:D-alanyl-D-alanine carboxypeptidase
MTSRARRRRRSSRWPTLAVALLAPLAVAATIGLALGDGSGGSAAPTRPGTQLTLGPPPREPAPLVRGEPLPAVPLAGADAFRVRFRKPPRAGLVLDLASGEVLWRRRALERLPIASLTKIMTALLVTELARPGERVRITRAALRYQGSGVGILPRGKRVPLEALLNGLMLVSGNDAAIALAGHVAGSEAGFVRLMNRRATEWGLACTRFVDSHGLGDRNVSCPRDLAVLTRLAMRDGRIRRIARRRQAALRFPVKGGRLFLYGHNPLIRLGYRGAIGLKTGYTSAAGRCFVGVARRGGRTLGVVLLRSPNTAKHATRLLDEGFASAR